MNGTTTILLVDDHAILREGLRAIIESQPNHKVVGQASNGRDAIKLAAELCPAVVVMDIAMPDLNGVDAVRRIVAANPAIKVIILSVYSDKQFVLAALESGASGYVLKASASDELMRAIRAVLSNQKFVCPEVVGVVVDEYTGRPITDGQAARGILSEREREVLQLLAEGHTSRKIAERLDISENTIDVHRRNIMQKLNLHSIAELTKYAIREGLTSA